MDQNIHSKGSTMKINVSNLTYYIGWFLVPACIILCLLEFIYHLDKEKEKFYFMESLKWFTYLETPQEVVRIIFIVIISIVCTIAIILIFTAPAQAGEWSSVYSQKVRLHQNVTINNIIIPDIQFSSPVTGHLSNGKLVLDYPVNPVVFLDIFINGVKTSIILEEGQTYTDNKSGFQITALGFTASDSIAWEYANYNPSVTLSINTWQQNNIPSLKINIKVQNSSIEYGKLSIINIVSDITNTGKTLVYADVSPDFGSLSTISSNTKRRIVIDSGTTQSLDWNINIPTSYGSHTLNIIATIPDVTMNYPDGTYTNKTLSFSSNTTIQITPPTSGITIQKIIPERLYTCVNTSIILVVSNTGIYDIKNITIIDKVPNTFIAATDSFVWNIPEIKSKDQISVFERVTPLVEGSYTVEAAEMTYFIQQTYRTSSNTPATQIIFTGKNCKASAVQIINSPEQVYVEHLPDPIQPEVPVQTTVKKEVSKSTVPIPTVTPIVWTPGFESVFGVIVLLAAYKFRKVK